MDQGRQSPEPGDGPVPRRPFLVLDRHRLQYLNAIEKANCTFCSYANGAIAYVHDVAARTEQYWCPIKHATDIAAPHHRYHLFFDYGDAQAYRRDLPDIRAQLHRCQPVTGDAEGDDARRTA